MKKKKKEVIDEELYKQSKIMLVTFVILGIIMVSAIILSATVQKGTYSAETCFCTPAISNNQNSCEAGGGTWQCTVQETCAQLGGQKYCYNYQYCTTISGASDGTCYQYIRDKTCKEIDSSFYPSCSTQQYCGIKNSYGCYYEGPFTIGTECNDGKGRWTSTGCKDKKYAYFYSWDGSTYIAKCEILDGSTTNCDHNPNSVCVGWSTSTYSNSNNANISSGGTFYCAANYSVHDGCCSNYQSGATNDEINYPDGCIKKGGTWTCTIETPAPSQSPTPSPSNSPKPSNSPSPEPSNSPTPETPTPSQSPTPSKSCYECTLNGKTQHVYATSAANAASAATTLKGVTASNCKTTDNKNCEAIKVKNCYECDVNGTKKTTTAYSETEAASNVNGKNCTIVSANKCNVPVNPKTGTIAIIVAWIVGILTIGYSFWYFKKSQTL